jgi:DNA recombination protein Rad52
VVSPEQKKLLERPLSPDRIKQRSQSGMKLSYIEGWDAIQKANEIFGYGEWSYEIIKLDCLGTREHSKDSKKGWHTAYLAVVQVQALGRSFDEVGYGDSTVYGPELTGHEMAAKEAVTDALKRGLKNFGDQFGLTLYDKEQKGVGYGDEAPEPVAKAPQAPPVMPEATPEALVDYQMFLINIMGVSPDAVDEQLSKAQEKYGGIIPAPWVEHMMTQAKIKAGVDPNA